MDSSADVVEMKALLSALRFNQLGPEEEGKGSLPSSNSDVMEWDEIPPTSEKVRFALILFYIIEHKYLAYNDSTIPVQERPLDLGTDCGKSSTIFTTSAFCQLADGFWRQVYARKPALARNYDMFAKF